MVLGFSVTISNLSKFENETLQYVYSPFTIKHIHALITTVNIKHANTTSHLKRIACEIAAVFVITRCLHHRAGL